MNFDFNRIQGKKSYADDTMSTIRMNVTKNPDKTAVIFGDQGLKWRELWERSNRLANGLKGLGLNQNERVIIFLPNCMEYPEAILGINKAGLVACGTNVRLTGPEVAYQLNDSGARAIILKGVEQLELIMGIRGQVPDLEHIIMVDDASEGAISYGELLSKSSGEEPETLLAPDDVHLLMYTSGTTGKPKAAARTCKSDYHMANAVCHNEGLGREGCVGKPVFDLELAVLDEEGKIAPQGEPGVLYGRGYSMWEGYLNKPEATAEAYLDHEWGTVGDIAKLGADGNLYIVDRKSDMIITGGINVYPVEIENVLMHHEAVADVAVIGVPDEKWGEAVKALVVPGGSGPGCPGQGCGPYGLLP